MKPTTATPVISDETKIEPQPPSYPEEHDHPYPAHTEPHPPHQNLLDDIFGSRSPSPSLSSNAADAHTNQHLHDDPSEIPRLRRIHHTDGYREGFAQGKESNIQAGFDEGYTLGAELGLRAGWCSGVLGGLAGAVVKVEGELLVEDVHALLRQAEEELAMQRLFGREFFGEDGIWVFDVPKQPQGSDEGDEEAVSFAEVAAAHPLVKKWESTVKKLAKELGLEL